MNGIHSCTIHVNLGRSYKNYPGESIFFMSLGETRGPLPKEKRGKEKREKKGERGGCQMITPNHDTITYALEYYMLED